ncbi:bactericidal permeability-increasing protein-like [Ornithorhynchus anatinus]|uniref:bactericidal permeability-increasing protein-like n=1 Tax=Ornithorhynchus anatinus TaxID=9258 RepID=UPI0010A75329|nr:bactericidal permeability-increasing protein-like [Ornithorhynchus anatinus]
MVVPIRTWAALVALVGVAGVWAANPGFVVRISQKGLDYARQESIVALEKELLKINLPDFSGSFKIKHFGKGHYDFNSLEINNFRLPTSQISLLPGQGLRVAMSNAFIQVSGHWKARKNFIKLNGSFNLKVEGLSIMTDLHLGSDQNGRPTVSASACNSQISNVKVHISGRLSWILNLFHKKIESRFRKSMEGKICEKVMSAARSKLQPYLQTLPVTAKIDKVAGIDYALVHPPKSSASTLDVGLKGEFFNLNQRSPPPFAPPELNFPPASDRMAYFGVSDYFFNTAFSVYHKAGALRLSVSDDMIPKESKIRLNTASFGGLIPQLAKTYPNVAMKLVVSTAAAPSLSIRPGSLNLGPDLDVEALALPPNASEVPLFLLGLSTNASVEVGVRGANIFGSTKLGRLNLELKQSSVGPFSVTLLEAVMNFYVSQVLLPKANERLEKGFPLPLFQKLQLSNLVLQPLQNFLLLGADIHHG